MSILKNQFKLINQKKKNSSSNITSQNNINMELTKSTINATNNLKIAINILSKIKKSTSQIIMILNKKSLLGTGFFYYDTPSDLSKGYFITAAHCVIDITGGVYNKVTELYLQNPINNKWTSIDVNKIYVDGVADVALIITNINFTNNPNFCLKISNDTVNDGDMCYIAGNTGGLDEDSISVGYVRDANYCDHDGYWITNSIYTSCPADSGNSGGPIIDINGNVIGIFCFGNKYEYACFGGGPNKEVLKLTLPKLKNGLNNKLKLYLGLEWFIPSPFLLLFFYNNKKEFNTLGVYINTVSPLSPFLNILSVGDLLLSCKIGNITIEFGNKENQRTPGVLLYYPLNTLISISYIKTTIIINSNVILNKNYSNVNNLLDYPGIRGKTGILDEYKSIKPLNFRDVSN